MVPQSWCQLYYSYNSYKNGLTILKKPKYQKPPLVILSLEPTHKIHGALWFYFVVFSLFKIIFNSQLSLVQVGKKWLIWVEKKELLQVGRKK